jgi:hypothetical protein
MPSKAGDKYLQPNPTTTLRTFQTKYTFRDCQTKKNTPSETNLRLKKKATAASRSIQLPHRRPIKQPPRWRRPPQLRLRRRCRRLVRYDRLPAGLELQEAASFHDSDQFLGQILILRSRPVLHLQKSSGLEPLDARIKVSVWLCYLG